MDMTKQLEIAIIDNRHTDVVKNISKVFWSLTEEDTKYGCILWNGRKKRDYSGNIEKDQLNDYGKFNIGSVDRSKLTKSITNKSIGLSVHRLGYILRNWEYIDNSVIRHRCKKFGAPENKRNCVLHLVAGSYKENAEDMAYDHGNFNCFDIHTILENSENLSIKELSEAYECTYGVIRSIFAKVSWRVFSECYYGIINDPRKWKNVPMELLSFFDIKSMIEDAVAFEYNDLDRERFKNRHRRSLDVIKLWIKRILIGKSYYEVNGKITYIPKNFMKAFACHQEQDNATALFHVDRMNRRISRYNGSVNKEQSSNGNLVNRVWLRKRPIKEKYPVIQMPELLQPQPKPKVDETIFLI